MEHTTLPWFTKELIDNNGENGGWEIDNGKTKVSLYIDKAEDVEFIVRACNSHYELLGVVKEDLNHWGEKAERCDDVIKSCEFLDIARELQAVIAKAEGKQ